MAADVHVVVSEPDGAAVLLRAVVDGELAVEWVALGEGPSGDGDPTDLPLLRFDVRVTEAAAARYGLAGEQVGDGWFVPEGTSVCSLVPVAADPQTRRTLLVQIGVLLHATFVSGGSLQREAQRLSWTTVDGVPAQR